jgi:transcriptional regulator with XRE-family HTH domain
VGILIQEIIDKYITFMKIHYPTQGAAAEDLNISRSHLNKIINKRDKPSLSLLDRMEKKMKEYNYEL